MSMDGLPYTSSEAYMLGVLEYAARLGFPAIEMAGTAIAGGREGRGTFVAGADRRQLFRPLGIVIAMAHRAGTA